MIIDADIVSFARNVGNILDFFGVLVIVGGFIVSGIFATGRFLTGEHENLYRSFRSSLARSILLGLEFLVAGDIIRTVAGELSLNSVIVLSVVVLIRTLLGLEFQVELDGRWPWDRARSRRN